MNKFSSIFGQILQIFSKGEFYRAVVATEAEKGAKGFTCWQQFVAMLFCQLGQSQSLREITGALASCLGKLRHLGVACAPHRSTLSYVGTSPNALMIQIWTALIAILILKYLKFRSTFGWSLSNLVAMLRYNLFTYRDLWQWIDHPYETPPIVPDMEQLSLRGM